MLLVMEHAAINNKKGTYDHSNKQQMLLYTTLICRHLLPLSAVTFGKTTLCPHSLFMFFVFVIETAVISLHNAG
jgi:hypothetical protein